MAILQIPNWCEAPEELFAVDGHCGLLATWLALAAHGKTISVPELINACRHTKRHGVFTVSLATALTQWGLTVSFHTDPDLEIGGFERKCYARARRSGVLPQPALTLEQLLNERRRGRLPIVLFNTDSDEAHFSPLLGKRRGKLLLPLSQHGNMSDQEFLMRWSAPGILRQCVTIKEYPRRNRHNR